MNPQTIDLQENNNSENSVKNTSIFQEPKISNENRLLSQSLFQQSSDHLKIASPKISPNLLGMPKEILEIIWDMIPNKIENKIESLTLTSSALNFKVFNKTKSKIKTANLLEQIKELKKQSESSRDEDHIDYQIKALDVYSIFREIRDERKTPLDRQQLMEVLVPLSEKIGPNDLLFHRQMLDTFTDLESVWNTTVGLDKEEIKKSKYQNDFFKSEIIKNLAIKSYYLSGQGKTFDKIFSFIKSIDSPKIINKTLKEIKLIYWFQHGSRRLGLNRFDEILFFIEKNIGSLEDETKLEIIDQFSSVVDKHSDERKILSYCQIINSISRQKEKEKASYLLLKGFVFHISNFEKCGNAAKTLLDNTPSIGDWFYRTCELKAGDWPFSRLIETLRHIGAYSSDDIET